ncbi:MAG: EpsI family protein [Nitrospirota bacterium]|jgi:EpsI family protein
MAWRFSLAVLLVVGAALWVQARPFEEVVPVERPLAEFPVRLGDWTGTDQRWEDYVYEQLKVSDSLLRHYRNPAGDNLYLYVGYYASQREGMQIHSPRHCLPGGGWAPVWSRGVEVRDPRLPGGGFTAREALYGKGRAQTLFLYWYQMGPRFTTNEYALKLFMVEHALRYHRTDAAFVRLSMGVGEAGPEVASAMLSEFAALSIPHLLEFLPR